MLKYYFSLIGIFTFSDLESYLFSSASRNEDYEY